jgi:hypothetical protein
MLTASATDMDAKFSLQRSEPPLQCTDNAGGDAGNERPGRKHDF